MACTPGTFQSLARPSVHVQYLEPADQRAEFDAFLSIVAAGLGAREQPLSDAVLAKFKEGIGLGESVRALIARREGRSVGTSHSWSQSGADTDHADPHARNGQTPRSGFDSHQRARARRLRSVRRPCLANRFRSTGGRIVRQPRVRPSGRQAVLSGRRWGRVAETLRENGVHRHAVQMV